MARPFWCVECKFRRWPGDCSHSPHESQPLSEEMVTWMRKREGRIREEWKLGLWPLGMIAPLVAGGATTVITVRPEITPFIPKIFVVSTPDIDHFFIADIKIGKNSCFASSGEIPASAFRGRSLKEIFSNIDAPSVRAAMDLHVTVRNTKYPASRFSACMFGQVPKDLAEKERDVTRQARVRQHGGITISELAKRAFAGDEALSDEELCDLLEADTKL